ncbi:MAG: hypothetical protein DRI93_04475 [Aquificota bacterium]|nr:MAG: hypothetical protein DRI93_04475 [Aquificota bacterium]
MSPKVIVEEARKKGLDLIAVTDHNACESLVYVKKVADGCGLALIPGMELQTEEEVHLLAYFGSLDAVFSFKEAVYPFLPDVENDPDYFGDQVVVDEDENIVGFEEKLLINSLLLSLDQCVEMVRDFGGFPVPAHVDRESFSIIGHLGFVPEHLGFEAVEVSRATSPEKALEMWPELSKYVLLSFSDAHYPGDVGAVYTEFYMESPSFEELVRCLRGEGDRRLRVVSQSSGGWE